MLMTVRIEVDLSRIQDLSPKQTRAAVLLASGLMHKQIAGELGVSLAGATKTVQRVYQTLGVKTSAEVAIMLQAAGLLNVMVQHSSRPKSKSASQARRAKQGTRDAGS